MDENKGLQREGGRSPESKENRWKRGQAEDAELGAVGSRVHTAATRKTGTAGAARRAAGGAASKGSAIEGMRGSKLGGLNVSRDPSNLRISTSGGFQPSPDQLPDFRLTPQSKRVGLVMKLYQQSQELDHTLRYDFRLGTVCVNNSDRSSLPAQYSDIVVFDHISTYGLLREAVAGSAV